MVIIVVAISERNRLIANIVDRIDRSACVFCGILTIIISSHNF